MLNLYLIEKQGLTTIECNNLVGLHKIRESIFEAYKNLNNKESIIYLNHTLENLEYEMQRVWKFKENSNYHTWWYRIPGCTCNIHKNDLSMGLEVKYINSTCPFHGDSLLKEI